MFDAFELNKIAGAVLFSILLLLGVSILTDSIFDVEAPEKPGYVIEVAEAEGAAKEAEPAAAEPEMSLADLLAKGSAEKGQSVAKKCTACHTFDEGGANRVGPNLHGIVGRAVASHEGFAYSDAMKGHGGDWTYEALEAFLKAPKEAVPGTAMSFAGVRKEGDRADLIVYLKSVSPAAPDLPAAGAAAPAEASEPATEQPAAEQPAAEQPAAAEPSHSQ